MHTTFKSLCLLLVSLNISGCSDNWGWYVVSPATESGRTNLKFLIDGLGYTIALSVCAISISVVIGLAIALPGLAHGRTPKALKRIYVECFRAIPILVLLLWVYYGLPVVLDIGITAFWAGVVALAISDSAFEAEIFRGGIQSIAKGQSEAADSIGLTYFDKMRYVILP